MQVFAYPFSAPAAARIAHLWAARAALAVACAALVGCSTTKAPEPTPAPAQPTLQELMNQAEAAGKEGQRETARLRLRDAAKAYPTDIQPWQRLAESYFEAADYGNAILAAQEVMQRDRQNRLAQGILAVSGLRVSVAALGVMREQQNGLPANTRDEASTLARQLRETLGEPVLVPRPADPPAPPPPKPVVRRPAAAAPVRPAAAPATTALAPAPAVAAPKPAAAPGGSPFDKLK